MAVSFRHSYSRIKKSLRRIPKTALFSLVFLSFFVGNASFIFAQTPRPISDYVTLWGTQPSPQPTKEALKKAEANGIGYLGPKLKAEGGFDDQGNLKKMLTIVSLNIDQAKFRSWNMVAGSYWTDLGSNKKYLRLLDESFIARIYQIDSAGVEINESLSRIKLCSFLNCSGNSAGRNENAESLANTGKPLSYIVKYASGSSIGSNFWNGTTDGYDASPQGTAPLSFGGALVAGGITGSVIPGVGTLGGAVLGIATNYLLPTDGSVLVMGQTAIVDVPINTQLDTSKKAYVELWYLGSDRLTTSDTSFKPAGKGSGTTPPYPNTGNDRIKYFDISIEGGYNNKKYPFFKIGEAFEFSPTASIEDAQTQAGVAQVEAANTSGNLKTNDDGGFLPACDILNGYRPWSKNVKGTLMGCVAQVSYNLVYRPIAWFAGIMGNLFDFFLGYSLDDSSYRADFAVRGWQLVRDISNIFFIIILVWTGLSAVFNTGTNIKKVVPNLILNALLINFSLFGVRAIIDLSNVFSRVFYNNVEACQGKCVDANKDGVMDNELPSITKYKPLSEVITSGFNPQKLFSAKVIDSTKALPPAQIKGVSGVTYSAEEQGIKDDSETAGYFVIVCLIAAAIMFAVAKMFWGVTFMFLGRVIGLYISMIFAPFAVLSHGNIPLISNIKELSWDTWWKDVTSYALLAPIFVFFLYIISSFIKSGFMDIYLHSLGDSFLENIIAVSIPMLIIYFMLSKGVSIAKKYAGTIGEAVQSFAQKSIGAAAGVGLGIATGGAALGMRGGAALLGQGAKKFGLTNWAAANAENSSLARWTNKSLNKMQTSSFDIRNAGLKIGGKEYTAGNAMSKGFGLFGEKLNYGLADGVGLGQKDYLGGNVKIRQDRDKRKVENIDKEINFDQLTDDEAKAVAEKKIVALAKKKAEADWKENVDVDDIVQNSQAFKNLKQKELQLEADLARSKASGSSGGQQVAQQALAQNKVAQDNVKKQITDTKANDANAFQAMKLQTVDDLKKNGEYKNSKAYSDVTNDERTRFTQEYGEIKDVKTLTSFSRSEYAKNLRNNSFWMKDGKPRWGLSTGGGLAAGDMTATLAGIGGLTTMIDAGIGAIFGAHIKEVQNSFDRASETVANRHGKTIKGNNLATHEEQLKILNKKLKKELEDNGTLMDADKASAKEIEDAIIAGIARRNKLIKLLEKKEREGAVLTDDEERNLARHQKELSDLKRMESERSNHIDKIDSIKNARKKADDAKNKPQGGDDQKKES